MPTPVTNNIEIGFMRIFEALKTRIKRFAAHKTGLALVEFAMLMPIFLGVVICTMEAQVDYYCQSTLDNAVYSTYTQIQNGTAFTNGWSASDYIDNAICPAVSNVITCSDLKANLIVALPCCDPTYTGGYEKISVKNTTQTFEIWNPVAQNVTTLASNWCLGSGGQAQVLQVAYPIPFLTIIWAGSLKQTNPYFITTLLFWNTYSGGTAVTTC